MTIPNLITLGRLLAVPLIVILLIDGAFGWAFAAFLLAGVSDGIDGAIARHVRGQASALGRLIDPIADKTLLVTLFVVLGLEGRIPAWLAVVVVSRDLLIVGGILVSWLAGRPVPIAPLPVSKANTAVQLLYLSLLLAALGLAWPLERAITVTGWLVAVLTVVSAGAYLRSWLKHMRA